MKPPVVLVIRGDDSFSSLLRNSGCEVLNLELIKTAPATDLTELDKTLARIADYDGLFFTSLVAAEVFADRSKLGGHEFGGKVYVLGERAKTVLVSAGFDVFYAACANTAEDMIASFDEAEFAGKRLLFVRGDKSLRTIPDLLASRAKIDEVIVYKTREIPPDKSVVRDIRDRLRCGDIDWICFFSPSGLQSFRKLFASEWSETVKIAAIGETTAREAQESNLTVDFVSKRANAEDFAAGLIGHIKNIE